MHEDPRQSIECKSSESIGLKMIKQLKQTNNIDEANELLDRGWVLLSYANNFVLGAKEEIWGKEKEPHVSEVLKNVDENFANKIR